jgi:hypothetical protein
MMSLGQCKHCVFFRVSVEATELRPFAIGTCHYEPPKVLLIRMARTLTPEEPPETPADGYRYETVWPTTAGELGCGRFMAKDGDH